MSNKHKIFMLVILIGIVFSVLIAGKYVAGEISADKVSFVEVSKYEYNGSEAKEVRNWRFSSPEAIDRFIKGLNRKERTYEKIDIRPRDFKVVLHYNRGESDEYSLWLNERDDGQGVLMLGDKLWYLNSNMLLKDMLK